MENAVNTLRIQNFKSIKDVKLKPRRINLIIGNPNVGKSNILEALSLFGGIVYEKGNRFMESFIRYEEPRQLFYDNLVANIIRLTTDKEVCTVGLKEDGDGFSFLLRKIPSTRRTLFYGGNMADSESEPTTFVSGDLPQEKRPAPVQTKDSVYTEFNTRGLYGIANKTRAYNAPKKYPESVKVRPYSYSKRTRLGAEQGYLYLQPPYGNNLVSVIQAFPQLRREVAELFEPYGLKLLLRVDERRLEVIKDLEGVVYSFPYSGIADTLQRIIFYLAAIESNEHSVLLFEEPEAHTFPVYTTMLGQKIVDSTTNQFFVATHSPYLLTEIVEGVIQQKKEQELGIFLAYYENYQTKLYQFTEEEVREIRRDAIDVFYNLGRYTPHANPYA